MSRDWSMLIRDVPDFPKPCVVFKDIGPLLASPTGFAAAIEALATPWRDQRIDAVAAMEARGFIFGAPVAAALGAGFVPIRKPGKLPGALHGESYALEYGEDRLELAHDALGPGSRVLLVDDVLATGGTLGAAVRLVERSGATLAGAALLIELCFLGGRGRLPRDLRLEAALRLE